MKDATVLHETNRHELHFLSMNIIYPFLQMYFFHISLNSVLYYKHNFSSLPGVLPFSAVAWKWPNFSQDFSLLQKQCYFTKYTKINAIKISTTVLSGNSIWKCPEF